MHVTTGFFTGLALCAVGLAAPLASREESWPVTTLETHFMGRDTGLPGNTWPESAKFNSTIAFTVSFPSGSVGCSANWKEHEVVTTPVPCGAPGVEFQLSPTSAGLLTEAAFLLTVRKTVTDTVTGTATTLAGSQEILANSPGKPNSYLSCLGGPPLDGIRCKSTGWASTAGPLVLLAH